MKVKGLIAAVCMASFALSGCAGKYVQPKEFSGFLVDYSTLEEASSPSGAAVLRWVDPKVEVGRFTSVLIEPSQLYPRPKATEQVPQSTLDGITQYYDQALQREFSKVLTVVTTPGAGTLIVRPAITAVSAKPEGLKAYEVIPIALVAAGVSYATGIRDEDTSLATEAAFINASDTRLVAQVVRKGAGKTLENSSQIMQPKDAKSVLDGWAADMAQSFLRLKLK